MNNDKLDGARDHPDGRLFMVASLAWSACSLHCLLQIFAGSSPASASEWLLSE